MTVSLPDLPPSPDGVRSGWQLVPPRPPSPLDPGGPSPALPLRCWSALPEDRPVRSGVLVLPEVFGINAWVRSVADRLAAAGHAVLAVPLFSRTAPELELGYDADSLVLGRSHKERTTTETLLLDLSQAADWLAGRLPGPEVRLGCVGFCFGGHVAMLAATLPRLAASVDFYGAGVAVGRPGGGPPTLMELPRVTGRLLCLCGEEDPLIPDGDVRAIERALAACPSPQRHRLIRVPGAGHGYMCEARSDFRPVQAAEGWRTLLAFLQETLLADDGSASGRPDR
ncbi:MAG: dienelactone hydrolase family protein [Cyanobium sp.]